MLESYEEFEEFISNRIAKLREHKKISARDLSLSLGFGPSYINNIENKNNMPSLAGLFFICDFFKIEPKDFFDDGLSYPELVSEVITRCKKLDEQSLRKVLEFITWF